MLREKSKRREVSAKTRKASPAKNRLETLGITEICDAIVNGKSMTQIAKEAGVSIGTLIVWLAGDPERSARAREARAQSARYWDERAAQVIEKARNQLALGKARELAHHYRWRAAKIAPREYGDKLAHVGGGPDDSPVGVTVSTTVRDAEAAMAVARLKLDRILNS